MQYKARQTLQDKAIRLPSSEVYRETFNFVVMKDFANDNPEATKRFLRAEKFIGENKDESIDIVAERLKLDKKFAAVVWDDFVFKVSLDQSLLTTMEAEARWAINSGLTDKTKVPNYLDYTYLDALEEVKPEAVAIVR